MKKLRLLIVLLLLVGLVPMTAQNTWFVKKGNSGNGTSWEKAFGDFQDALKVAKANDQIWVAAGKYLPTSTNDRNKSFIVKSGVSIYGGFSGIETTIDQRDWRSNITVLSGDIGTSSPMDNSYTVLQFKNVSENTIIDGLVIADGEATGSSDFGNPMGSGAAILNIADATHSSPIIVNCRFVNNYAFYGAAICNYTVNNGSCTPTIIDSEFERNIAFQDGGVMYNSGKGGKSYPIIRNSVFTKNAANYGSIAYTDYPSNCKNAPLFQGCQFIQNTAITRGEVYYDGTSGNISSCYTKLQKCIFNGNSAQVGSMQRRQLENRDNRAAYR